ncbi:hypothetical protein [Lysinibacillus fusiformis]|uniref:hypothetical protein n=1 Tax=Lysinibacillus fusiformis TaxID=28031 RepID=UPI0021C21BFB|nr:hypothetical protein [Lysinibacillus fusiformis]UXJ67818.1 hypothetical protein N5069_16790 [Lysinibacillus fusiformis]
MCLYGVYRWVNIINKNQNKNVVAVDACIAEEVQILNERGIKTIGCCCGHGRAGQIVEYQNGFGIWKEREYPPHVLIAQESINIARQLGYNPYPYFSADGKDNGVSIMPLKSGCLTELDCKKWHQSNSVEYKRDLGIIK